MKKNLIVVCGPTATGKTALAITLAKQFNSEIISADSRQVYQGLDIGTGKDIPISSKFKVQNSKLKIKNKNYQIGYREKEGLPIWLVDICKPNQEFSVAHFVRFATLVTENIWSRNKLPIIVGGTGFYLKSLLDGVNSLNVKPDLLLRRQLDQMSVAELQHQLRRLNQIRLQQMNHSDVLNPRRLIRAIEVAKQSAIIKNKTVNPLPVSNLLLIGLSGPLPYLSQRINLRVEERVEQGIVTEIKHLIKNGYRWDNSIIGVTIGYREWRSYFVNNLPMSEVISLWQQHEIAYAKRQLTWFKKIPNINWFDVSRKNSQQQIEKIAFEWYHRANAEEN